MPKENDSMDFVSPGLQSGAGSQTSSLQESVSNAEELKDKLIIALEEVKNDEELDERAKELLALAINFKPSKYSGDHRDPDASSYGGF